MKKEENHPVEGLHAGHRARIRERFRREGLSGFSEHEVLELLLTYAIPYRDVNPLAHTLITQFGSLAGVLEADESELMRMSGIGENAAVLLTLMPPLFGVYQHSAMGARPVITNFAEARRYCAALFHGLHEEVVYMICLDQRGTVLHPAPLHRGTVDEVTLYPRAVVETALRHHAHAVLLAHNHPSGFCKPSQADYRTTKLVIHALSVISVSVVDHLILAGGDVYSMMHSNSTDAALHGHSSYMAQHTMDKDRADALREPAESRFVPMQLSLTDPLETL